MSPLIDFVFVLDKKGQNIVFIILFFTFCWFFVSNKMGRKIYCFGFYPFVDDWQKEERDFEFYMHTYVFAYIKFKDVKFYMHIYGFAYIKFN